MGERLEMMGSVRESWNNPLRADGARTEAVICRCEVFRNRLHFLQYTENFSNLIPIINTFSKMALHLGEFQV